MYHLYYLFPLQMNPSAAGWQMYADEAQSHLEAQEVDFSRPPADTDRLYMNIGGSDVIEVGHPPMPDEVSLSIIDHYS